MSRKILVVDDDKRISDIITINLKKEGYEVICAYDGEQGLSLAFTTDPELILLDVMMPKMNGFDVCKKIREKSQTPIIMLTARTEEIDTVLGFELGADDYVTKPFGMRELFARIKANLRRWESAAKSADETAKPVIQIFGELSFDTNRMEVSKRGKVIELTRREYELLFFLASQKNLVFSRETLLEKVWGYEYFGDVRGVDVTVRRLRLKLEDNPDNPKYVLTKRSVGYYFGD